MNDRKTRSGEKGEKETVTRIQGEAEGTGTSENDERREEREEENHARDPEERR